MPEKPPFVSPLIICPWAWQVCTAWSEHTFFHDDLMQIGGINHLVQLLRVERVNDGKRPLADGSPIGSESRQVDPCTEVRHLVIRHTGATIAQGDVQTRHPPLLVEDLWTVAHEPLHAEVLRACHVPDNPGNRVEIGTGTMAQLGRTELAEEGVNGLRSGG